MCRSLHRLAVAILVAVVIAGCGSAPPPSAPGSAAPGSPAPGSAASSGPATSEAAPGSNPAGSNPAGKGPAAQVGPVDPAGVAALIGPAVTDKDSLGAAASALGAALRARVNATATYGPVATDLESLADQADAAALQDVQAKLGSLAGGARAAVPDVPANPAVPSRLAGWRGGAPGASATADMALLSVAMLFVIALGGVGIGMYEPKAGDIPPTTLTSEETRTTGTSTVHVRVTLTVSSAAGIVTATIALTGDGSGTDATTGKTTAISGSSSFSFSINPCPDPAGRVSGTVAIADDETIAEPGGPTLGYRITGTTDYLTSVNDGADIDSTQMTSKMDRSITTASTGSGGGSGNASTIDIAVTGTDTVSGSGTFTQGGSLTVDRMDGPVVDADIVSAGGMVGTFGYGAPIMLVAFARDTWRGGRCFELRVAPDGGDVTTGSVTPDVVKVHHWVDKADIALPVTAALGGTKAIDPSGAAVTSPATFRFTAGQPTTSGTVTYTVTSRRGIAHHDSTFKVVSGLSIDIDGTLHEAAAGLVDYTLKVTARGLSLVVHNDGSVSVDGNATVKGTFKAPVVGCSGTINEKIPVSGTGSVMGPADAIVYRVLIGPASTSNLGGTIHCPAVGREFTKGDFFGQWSRTLGPVDIPAAGGTVPLSGSSSGLLSRTAKGTFTGTPH